MKPKAYLILIAILFFAAFLRFYRLPEMAPFDFDQEYAANFAYRVVHEYPIQFIGQPLSVQGLFMGPIGFYLLTPFYLMTNLHPIGGSIGSVIFGLFIIASYYYVGKSIISPEAGLTAAYVRAITSLGISSDLNPAPLTISEILILWLWWALYKYWHGKKNVFPLIGAILGLFTSMHPVHFPFFLVVLLFFLLKRSWPGFKNLFLAIIGFVIAISPLIIFEILHNFLEAKRFIELFIQPNGETRNLERFFYWTQFNLQEISRILTIDISHKEYVGALVILTISILVIKKIGFWKDKFHWVTYLLLVTTFLIYYGLLLPKNITEYYFLAITTLTTLYIGASLSLLLKHKRTAPIFFAVIIYIGIMNLNQLQATWNNPSKNGLYNKDFIVKEIIKRVPVNQEFYVSYIKLPGWNFGFDYLFKYHGRIPQTKEAKPPVFTIVIPKFLSEQSVNISAGNVGLILPNNQ